MGNSFKSSLLLIGVIVTTLVQPREGLAADGEMSKVQSDMIRSALKPRTAGMSKVGSFGDPDDVASENADLLSFLSPEAITPEEIGTGEFKDDDFPLSLVESRTLPQPPGECASSRKKGPHGLPWQTGYYEALAGQRYLLGVDIRGKQYKLAPNKASRRACKAFPNDAKHADDLACCIAGYEKAWPLLNARILSIIEDKAPKPVKTSDGACVSEYRFGEKVAGEACSALKVGHCASACEERPIRYLGCFSLGYSKKLASCKSFSHRKKLEHYLESGGMLETQAVKDLVNSATSGAIDASSVIKAGSASAEDCK